MPRSYAGNGWRHLRQLFGAGTAVGLTDRQLLERFACGSGPSDSTTAAFETILARHGSMVLAVCRQILGDPHAVEDAFQATFLVLVRRARSLRLREGGSLGPWLHGVAYRTAMKSRKISARRQVRERRVAAAVSELTSTPTESDDLRFLVHEEVNRLPAKYRAPVVLCYFEGRTHDEAAAALHWPVGTVRGRLARARDLMRSRLTRRGVAPAVVIGASALEQSARAEVGASLRDATVATAIKGAPVAAGVAALTKTVLRSLVVARVRIGSLAVLAIALLGTGAGVVVWQAPAVQPPDRSSAPTAAATAERAPTALVDRFGDLLPTGARARMGGVRFRHRDFVSKALYSSQGRSVVAVDDSGSIHVWDAATGRNLGVIGDSAAKFYGIALSPDGTTLATVDESDGLRLWNVATGREQRRWHGAKNEFYQHLAFSPDGQAVSAGVRGFDKATQKEERFINVWDTAAATERRRRFGGDWLSLNDLKFSPDGKTLATASNDAESNIVGDKPEQGSTRIWDVATGKERRRFSVEGCNFRSVAFSPDGRLIAAGVSDGTVRRYELATGQEHAPRLRPWNSHPPQPPRLGGTLVPAPTGGPVTDARPGAMECLMFSPDGSILAGGSMGTGSTGLSALAAIHLWDVARGDELRQIPAHQGWISSLAYSPDGRTLVTTGGELVVRLCDVATGNERLPQAGHRSSVGTLVISPADGTVFTAGQDGTVRQWDPRTGRELGIFATFAERVHAMAFAPDGKTLLLGGGPSIGLALWNVAERREVCRLAPFRYLCFSPDGKTIASGRRIWDTTSGNVLVTLSGRDDQIDRDANSFSFAGSADGKEAITVGDDGIRIWDVVSGKQVRWAVHSRIDTYAAALSPDGRILATNAGDPRHSQATLKAAIRLWELASGREVARLEGLEEEASNFAFSRGGRFLVACCNRSTRNPRDPTVLIWDLASGQVVRRFTGHLAAVWSAAFSADGRSVISGSADGTALVWDVTELTNRPQAEPLTADALKDRWNDLASGDARLAYRASWALSVPSAVPFLRDHLAAAPAAAQKGPGATEGPVGPPEVLRTLRAIAALERVGTPEARGVFERLVHGDPAALATEGARSALARLRNRRN
jgi:RNA polymerase sigma factor (sigma-70 family)